jgi:hypothetical protein
MERGDTAFDRMQSGTSEKVPYSHNYSVPTARMYAVGTNQLITAGRHVEVPIADAARESEAAKRGRAAESFQSFGVFSPPPGRATRAKKDCTSQGEQVGHP